MPTSGSAVIYQNSNKKSSYKMVREKLAINADLKTITLTSDPADPSLTKLEYSGFGMCFGKHFTVVGKVVDITMSKLELSVGTEIEVEYYVT